MRTEPRLCLFPQSPPYALTVGDEHAVPLLTSAGRATPVWGALGRWSVARSPALRLFSCGCVNNHCGVMRGYTWGVFSRLDGMRTVPKAPLNVSNCGICSIVWFTAADALAQGSHTSLCVLPTTMHG